MPDPNVTVSAGGKSSTYSYGARQEITLDEQLDSALARTGDPVSAAHLFMRWSESNSEIRDLIPDVVVDYIVRRMKQRAKEAKK